MSVNGEGFLEKLVTKPHIKTCQLRGGTIFSRQYGLRYLCFMNAPCNYKIRDRDEQYGDLAVYCGMREQAETD